MGGRRAVAALVVVFACMGAGVTSGCSGDDAADHGMQDMQGRHDSGSPSDAGDDGDAAGQVHNDADVTFATEMIPHHAQALRMVDMTQGRSLSPDFAALTARIRAAQAPEIDQMTGWLEDWGEPVPDSAGHMHGGDMTGMAGMPGMAGRDDLDRLEGASRPAFERMWLRMMIAHHEGAVQMGRTEVQDGQYPPAVGLARSIVASQTAEIDTMRDMLVS